MRTDRAHVEAIASRRLALLTHELDAAEPDLSGFFDGQPPSLIEVKPPGRHARALPRLGNWIEERLPAPLRGRVSLRPTHLRWLLLLLAMGLGLSLWVGLRGQGDAVPVVQVTAPSPAPTPSASASAPATSAAALVVVHVVGRVRHPGLVSLPSGSRVYDAVQKAGGVRGGTRLASLNLARPLVDGEQIVVGAKVVGAAAASAQPGSATETLINLNTAGLADFDTLPGVGPVTAQKILDWRTKHGAFKTVDELLEVDGIGPSTLADIAPHVTL